jgi:hypothetical protein
MVVFKTARLKIQRANQHIADIDDQISQFRSPDLQSISHEINPQTGDQFLHYDLKKSLPLEELALVIGDAIHNLKTATDHGWYTLLSLVAPKIAQSKYTKFPVYNTKSQLESALEGRKINSTHPSLFDFVVNDLRPYSEGGNNLLCVIHGLDITDKHKLLIPLARVSAVVDTVLENDAGESTKGESWGTMNDILPITIPISSKLKFKVKEYGYLAFDVVFNEGSPVQQLAISSTLRNFREITFGAIEAMEGFYAREREKIA